MGPRQPPTPVPEPVGFLGLTADMNEQSFPPLHKHFGEELAHPEVP